MSNVIAASMKLQDMMRREDVVEDKDSSQKVLDEVLESVSDEEAGWQGGFRSMPMDGDTEPNTSNDVSLTKLDSGKKATIIVQEASRPVLMSSHTLYPRVISDPDPSTLR